MGQIPLFEGFTVPEVAFSISGSIDDAEAPHEAVSLDDEVSFVAHGKCTKVTHSVDKDGVVTRRHIIVVDSIDLRPG